MKEQKGITLIALIITIIIIVILASVAIIYIIGDNGILTKMQEAKNKTEQSKINEEEQLNQISLELAQIYSTRSGESTDELTNLIRRIVKEETEQNNLKIYPVGSIYISTNSTNPSEFIGGTWESYGQGRTLIGAGTGTDGNSESIEFLENTTGGEYNHTLTVNQMPSHNHISRIYLNQPGYSQTIPEHYSYYNYTGYGNRIIYTATALGNKNMWSIGPSTENGGNESHNNIQPYIVTYMWKRVS